jgi:putative lipase involved disintegration of autophagic bodies
MYPNANIWLTGHSVRYAIPHDLNAKLTCFFSSAERSHPSSDYHLVHQLSPLNPPQTVSPRSACIYPYLPESQ